jgi:hypothetical protein
VRDGAPHDEGARRDDEPGLAERGEMLGLAVAVGVSAVGRAERDADREEGQQRRDEIRSGVEGLGDETEAVRLEPDDQLEGDEGRRRTDGDERRSPLGIHAPGARTLSPSLSAAEPR